MAKSYKNCSSHQSISLSSKYFIVNKTARPCWKSSLFCRLCCSRPFAMDLRLNRKSLMATSQAVTTTHFLSTSCRIYRLDLGDAVALYWLKGSTAYIYLNWLLYNEVSPKKLEICCKCFDRWIATAAHCLKNKVSVHVYFGIRSNGQFWTRRTVDIANQHIHPEYPSGKLYDIG